MSRDKQVSNTVISYIIFCLATIATNVTWAEDDGQLSKEKQTALSLEECIAVAIKHSFEVQLARLDFQIAQTDQASAESIFDTILSAQISYAEDRTRGLSVFAADHTRTNIYSVEAAKKLPSGTETTLSLGDTREWSNSGYVDINPAHTVQTFLQLRQPLAKNSFGYIDRRKISVTSLAIQNADIEAKQRIELLFAQVEQAYYRWVAAKRSLDIYQEILAKAEDLHRANAKNYSRGLIERGDFLASRANVFLRERDELLADNQYKGAQQQIKLLINIEPEQQVYPKQDLQYQPEQLTLADCLKLAITQRRDYQQAKRKLEIEDLILETKANARWPEIDLVASLSANGINAKFANAGRALSSEDDKRYFAGVEFSLPLENRLAKSEFSKATHNKQKAILGLKKLEREIVTEVKDALRDYLTFQVNIAKVKEANGLQLEKLQEEERRFKSGRSSTKMLIDYQQDYLNTELELNQGLLELALAKVNLEKILDVILEKYQRLL